jgi:mRNA-degrading endonuclease RelE of RelBE toxin-antitoxin system
MKDLVIEEAFLKSAVNLPLKIREKIVSQLLTFTKHPDDPDLDLQRLEGSKEFRSMRVDDTYRMIIRIEKAASTLVAVATRDSPYSLDAKPRAATPVHKPGAYANDIVIAPVDALDKLLVEEKYLALTKRLLELAEKSREVQFQFPEIETMLDAHLPPEARKFPNWWGNQKTGKRAHAFAWMAAGWVVSNVDIRTGIVKFARAKKIATP